jgi:hypothetical protein
MPTRQALWTHIGNLLVGMCSEQCDDAVQIKRYGWPDELDVPVLSWYMYQSTKLGTSDEALIYALAYLDIQPVKPLVLHTIHRQLWAALRLANKFVDSQVCDNAAWARFGYMSLSAMHTIERDFMVQLQLGNGLFIPEPLLHAYRTALFNLTPSASTHPPSVGPGSTVKVAEDPRVPPHRSPAARLHGPAP